ncbi:MAG: hypothetical protein HQM13_12325 [SAR324 cluster bacterium]|nr:hypothetical protein [SAR324 cluster bacterium]
MKKLLEILTVDSVRDLFRNRSFFLLIFIIILLDRFLKYYVEIDRSSLNLEALKQQGLGAAPYFFESLPQDLWNWLTDWRTLGLVGGLFLLKQLISMWPSSDMRKMHREEQGLLRVWDSLRYLRWHQFVWDAVAVGSVCILIGGWCLFFFLIARWGWFYIQSSLWLLMWGGLAFLAAPIGMAGFSYSSKLAVLSTGTYHARLSLFFKLLTSWEIFWKSWVFYFFRIALEATFVVIIPASLILTVENFWLRIILSGFSATPVYSYVKMASFKFFLEIYRPFSLVQAEYQKYLNRK